MKHPEPIVHEAEALLKAEWQRVKAEWKQAQPGWTWPAPRSPFLKPGPPPGQS